MIKSFLAHPLTRGLDLDSPGTTALRRQVINEKPFLKKIYNEWYKDISEALPDGQGHVLEIGSGAGDLSERMPLITSDTFFCPNIQVALDGQHLPFLGGGLRGIVLVNVLHHLPKVRLFFKEATRCVAPGGVIIMVEPWVTNWSRIVYRWLHSEPFDPKMKTWEFASSGPLSGANGALPWIVFERDRDRFEEEFPEWRVREIKLGMPFRYLASGGISMRNLMPGWSYGLWSAFENFLHPIMDKLAMFAFIVLVRKRP